MSKKSSKSTYLWRSYKETASRIITSDRTKHKHTKAHLSAMKTLSGFAGIWLGISALLIFLTGVITNSNLLTTLREQEGDFTYSERLSFLLVYFSIYLAIAILALFLKNLVFTRLKAGGDLFVLVLLQAVFLPLVLFFSFQLSLLIVTYLLCLTLLVIGKKVFKNYTYAGVNFYFAMCAGTLIGLAWGIDFFLGIEASTMTKILIFLSTPLLVIVLPSGFLHLLEMYDVICRERWRKIRHTYPHDLGIEQQFISIHVPTYSEPPDLVIETLNKLAAVEYDNYEVLVVDNNTEDPKLWLPVKEHCAKLGPKFRFFHFDNIKGAKGGALNHVHEYCDPRTKIIGVVDADYQVEPGFAKAIVGYFSDPKVGFIQTPHDYREWQKNLFLSMCYWEYKIFFHSAMISLNERDAGITVGTMCLVRKEALEKAGGWSEWCVTEDSELAIRIHDAGYSSIYIDKTFGRGLIPDSFEGYKKQRYRWTAGPVQEFRHYFKHFIGLSKRESKFHFIQRIFHLNHGLGNFLNAFNIPLMIIGIATIASMILHNEVIAVPFELWVTATIMLFASPLLMLLLYRVTIKATIPDIIGQAIAAKALSHVVYHAAIRTGLTGSAKWNRTSKFKSNQSYFQALLSTKEEIGIGLSLMLFVVGAYMIFPYSGFSLMLLIGVAYMTLDYFAAPVMALIGVWSFRHDPSSHEKAISAPKIWGM